MGSSTFQVVNDFFNVSVTRQGFGAKNVDSVTVPTLFLFNLTNQWLYKRVNLNLAINDIITLTGHTSGPNSIVAFDDIQVIRQACENPGWCDFENGKFNTV